MRSTITDWLSLAVQFAPLAALLVVPAGWSLPGATMHRSDRSTFDLAVVLCVGSCAPFHTNLLFAASDNTLGIALAASGRLHPVAAVLLMVGSSATVSWRATRRLAAVLPWSHH